MAQQFGLGRGLASLIPPKKNDDGSSASLTKNAFVSSHDVNAEKTTTIPNTASQVTPPVVATGVQEIALEHIVPNPHQPRLSFDETKLQELAQSVKEHGILQPLVVSQSTVPGQYEIIAGERRFRAAKKAGLATVPVIVRNVDEQEKLELAIIENIQRHDLNPIEEAKSFLRLADEFNLSQEAVAQKMGKSRSAVANTLRLLQLPIEIQRAVSEGKISEGHAKALLAIENPEKQRAVFDLIIKEELTVRETETKVQSIVVKPHIRSVASLNPELLERTEHLTQVLGTKVKISPSGKGGKVIIEYYAPEDLDGLLRRLEE